MTDLERMMMGMPEGFVANPDRTRVEEILNVSYEQAEQEVRKTSATGGEKGSKLARFDLIPPGALTELAKHFGRGAEKYDDNNWLRGYEWGLSYAAMQRHANAFWGGEDIDPETGTPHIIAVAWHAFALYEFMQRFPEYDTRHK